MAQKPPQGNQRTAGTTSPSPEYYIDLTVDSPLNLRTRPQMRRRNGPSQNSNGVETPQNALPQAQEANPVASDRDAPPTKRRRQNKGVKVKTVVKLDGSMTNALPSDVICLNDSVTGNTNCLSCPVCFEYLTSSRKPTTTRCGHIYCADCLEQTLVRLKKCPTCQLPITTESCTRLYI